MSAVLCRTVADLLFTIIPNHWKELCGVPRGCKSDLQKETHSEICMA